MEWNKLTKEEQDAFNNLAEDNQRFLGWYKNFMVHGNCPSCRFKFKTWDEFSFHFSSTHGVPEELIYEMVKEMVKTK